MTETIKVPDFTRYTKDHWSCLLYIEHVVVDHKGIPDPRRMNDADRDAAEEMEADGLLVWAGTGLNPVFSLTDAGWAVAGSIRRARAEKRDRSEWSSAAAKAIAPVLGGPTRAESGGYQATIVGPVQSGTLRPC